MEPSSKKKRKPRKPLGKHRPDLALEWHPAKNGDLTPMDVGTGTNRNVWWKCPNGPDHEWAAKVKARCSAGTGCPFCSGYKVSVTNSIANNFPTLVKEWHPTDNGDLSPSDFARGSRQKVWWKCDKGPDHEWQAVIASRVAGRGCPFCAGYKISVSNSLEESYPEIAKQWHPSKNGERSPSTVVHGTNYRAWWKCTKGPDHEWQAVVVSRTRLGAGCPFCEGKKASRSNNLAEINTDLAAQWHATKNGDLTPLDVTPASAKYAWWKCPAGHDHEWRAVIASRASGRGCPFCLNLRLSDTNRLSIVRPDIANEWHEIHNGSLTPHDVTFTGGKDKYWWRCTKNPEHEWEARIYDRINDHGCPYCSGNALAPENSLAVRAPSLLEEWDYENNEFGPGEVSYGSNQKCAWVCKVDPDHRWLAGAKSRVNGSGCPDCGRPFRSSKGEMRWLSKLQEEYPYTDIIHHAQPEWIGRMHLDIYLPEVGIAIEYQGRQHYEPMSYFGGEEAFTKTVERDQRKVRLCQANGVTVVQVNRNDPYDPVLAKIDSLLKA